MATPNVYETGDLVRLRTNPPFADASGSPADPTTVTLRVLDPTGVATTYTYPADILKDSTGAYHYDLQVATAGWWFYRWIGTGTVTAQDEQQFEVVAGRLS